MKAPRKNEPRKGRTDNTHEKGPSSPSNSLPEASPTSATSSASGGSTERKRFCGKKGRSGPPKDNRNAMRHGLKAGKLPADAKYIETRLNLFRRNLEDAVIESKGAVSITDASAINTAVKWERHGCLAQRWLRVEGDKLTPTDCLRFSEAIAKASDSRDKAIRLLDLDRDLKDGIIDALYTRSPEEG